MTKPRRVIAAPFEARIREIDVRPGDRVEAGAPLARLQSASMMRAISELEIQYTSLKTRITQLEGRRSIISQTLPTARLIEKEAKTYFDRVQSLVAVGNANAARVQETSVAYYTAVSNRASLAAELAAVKQEILENRTTLQTTVQALERIQGVYAGGKIVAPVSGIVGPTVVSVGEVLVAGKPILDIHYGTSHVLAYLPSEYHFAVSAGERVQVIAGGRSMSGEVAEVLPVADHLPVELRAQFRASPRNQLIRISIPQADTFTLLQRVEVTSCYVSSCASLAEEASVRFRGAAMLLYEQYVAARRMLTLDSALKLPPSSRQLPATAPSSQSPSFVLRGSPTTSPPEVSPSQRLWFHKSKFLQPPPGSIKSSEVPQLEPRPSPSTEPVAFPLMSPHSRHRYGSASRNRPSAAALVSKPAL